MIGSAFPIPSAILRRIAGWIAALMPTAAAIPAPQGVAYVFEYPRNELEFKRGTFRVRGDVVDVFPAENSEVALRLSLYDWDLLTPERYVGLENYRTLFESGEFWGYWSCGPGY